MPAPTKPISAPGTLRADPRGAQGHDQDAGAERERVGICLPRAAEDVNKPHKMCPCSAEIRAVSEARPR